MTVCFKKKKKILVLIFWYYKQCWLVVWMHPEHNKAACVWPVSTPTALGSTLEVPWKKGLFGKLWPRIKKVNLFPAVVTEIKFLGFLAVTHASGMLALWLPISSGGHTVIVQWLWVLPVLHLPCLQPKTCWKKLPQGGWNLNSFDLLLLGGRWMDGAENLKPHEHQQWELSTLSFNLSLCTPWLPIPLHVHLLPPCKLSFCPLSCAPAHWSNLFVK